MKLLAFNLFLLFIQLINGQNGTHILEYVEKQYTKLAETVNNGVEYPTYGDPLEPKWLSTEAAKGLKFEQGMYPGVLWFLYKYTGNDKWKQLAIKATDGLIKGENLTTTHDIGFVINTSFGNGFDITKNESYAKVLVKAAETFSHRYSSLIGCTRSWSNGKHSKVVLTTDAEFAVIVDNMMNLELFFKAWQITNNKTYYDMAVSHTNRTIKEHIRSDFSSYQCVIFNSSTGFVIGRKTAQGYSDETCWSRGQAWLVAGLTIAYRYTKLPHILSAAEGVSKYFIENSPEDYIPYFDFKVPKNALSYVPRDTSSAAIAMSGLLELHKYTNNSMYSSAASKIMNSLISDNYRANGKPEYKLPAIIVNGTHFYLTNTSNQAMSFGDYYFTKSIQYFL